MIFLQELFDSFKCTQRIQKFRRNNFVPYPAFEMIGIMHVCFHVLSLVNDTTLSNAKLGIDTATAIRIKQENMDKLARHGSNS